VARKIFRCFDTYTGIPYTRDVNVVTLVSTREFDSKVKGLLGEDDLAWLEFSLATNPTAHPVIPGTDGVRKMRFARPGMGKRGGVRVIYFYAVSAEIVLLLSAYAKNEKENLSSEDKKNLRNAIKAFKESLKA
jgi:hypothetical protein